MPDRVLPVKITAGHKEGSMEYKKAIIVGASSGIGKALAKRLSQNGYNVGISARRTELLKEIQKENSKISFIKTMDLSKPDEALRLFNDLISEMGGVDLVIISAGTGFINPGLEWVKEKDTIDVNVAGFAAIAGSAMSYFLKEGRGHLAGISSIAALRGSSEGPAYSASKAFVSNYMEGLRFKARKASSDIFVTDIQPGFVDTAMAKGEGLFWVASPEEAARQIYDAIRAKKRRTIITKRWKIFAVLMKVLPDWLAEKFL